MSAPVSRIALLDALRGAGILGILVVHVQLFAMPMPVRHDPTAYVVSGADPTVWLAVRVLADGKFLTLFALLFGAGIAIQAARGNGGRGATAAHYRRTAALLALGLLHAYLLWYGDMLVTFAVCAALVFPHRDRAPGWLIGTGLAVLAVAPLLSVALAWDGPEVLAVSGAWSAAPEAVTREVTAYRGGWLLQQAHRAPTAFEAHTSYLAFHGAWETSGLMLLGMGLFRVGLLAGRWPTRRYAALAAAGFGAGIPLLLLGARRSAAHGWDLRDHMLVGIHLDYWGNLLVGLGWVAAIVLLHRRGLVPRAVEAVGRTALSNYLLASVLCTAVFYGHGLGLFGSVGRLGQLGVVAAVWTVQLAAASWWVARFSVGPVEWVLRWAMHGRTTPLRLTAAEPAA